MKQATKEQAIALFEGKFYEGLTAKEIVDFQLFQDRLCMPFDVFHKAVTSAPAADSGACEKKKAL